jgi:hypothetical protein
VSNNNNNRNENNNENKTTNPKTKNTHKQRTKQTTYGYVPVVAEFEGESGVVRGLDDDEVSHEVRAQQQRQRLDHVWLLWDLAGKRVN